jgi:DNA modification methylase
MVEKLVNTFKTFLPCDWTPEDAQVKMLYELSTYSKKNGYSINDRFETVFIEAVNQKLALNNDAYKHILDEAYYEGIKLNYILKTKVKSLLDSADKESYSILLKENFINSDKMLAAFNPVSRNTTMEVITAVCKTDKQYKDVLNSIFSRFCFNIFEKECTFRFFSGEDHYYDDYFEFLSNKYNDICDRNSALAIIDVSDSLFADTYTDGCNKVLNAIKEAYEILNNHCNLAIYIPYIESNNSDVQWRLYADTILFAEKHLKGKIDRPYFRWEKIATQTCTYIKKIVPYYAEFEYAFQGFVYKDCFVLKNDKDLHYALLLIFEKNMRDERLINCPACHTVNVQGNSYPILNVRSWECKNPLCPDRSKYNRGKRFAFMSLFRQRVMLEDANIIPESSIAKWRLDCLEGVSKEDAFEMVIRHYSCVNDGIILFTNYPKSSDTRELGRNIRYTQFSASKSNLLADFKSSTYFYRYLQDKENESKCVTEWTFEKAKVIEGDALDVLRMIENDSIDGVVTSPPYYNAKSYSQWPNIYCYLFDMFNIIKEIYRVMKDGSVFLFNIFDYFDNENNIVLSAMGNKRMILGAYMIDIFERVGFEIRGNIIWNKGEIQGNRSFNQGNLTPYYQAPLNCWEHILILSKGKPNNKYRELISDIKDIRPVIKMIRGKNVLGHDAPYPQEIPELLISYMNKNDIVLDPFLGSGTTCIVANKYGVRSIGIEKSKEYFALCKEMIEKNAIYQLSIL